MIDSNRADINRTLRRKYLDNNSGFIKCDDYDLKIVKVVNGYVWNVFQNDIRILTFDVRHRSKNIYEYSVCSVIGIFQYKFTSLIQCLYKLDEHISSYINMLKL